MRWHELCTSCQLRNEDRPPMGSVPCMGEAPNRRLRRIRTTWNAPRPRAKLALAARGYRICQPARRGRTTVDLSTVTTATVVLRARVAAPARRHPLPAAALEEIHDPAMGRRHRGKRVFPRHARTMRRIYPGRHPLDVPRGRHRDADRGAGCRQQLPAGSRCRARALPRAPARWRSHRSRNPTNAPADRGACSEGSACAGA